jgi:hypothetical protein
MLRPMNTWRRDTGLVTWTFAVPARASESPSGCLQRVTIALLSPEPFARGSDVELRTQERGDEAFVFAGAALDPGELARAFTGAEHVRRALLTLDLQAFDSPDAKRWIDGAARVFVDLDEPSRVDGAVELWLSIDIDIYAPVSWGECRGNRARAALNDPLPAAFLLRIESELSGVLEEIDAGDYIGQVGSWGFVPAG